MRKIPKNIVPILLGLSLILGFYVGVYSTGASSENGKNLRLQKMSYLLQLIEEHHLDASSVDSLLEGTIEELLHQLDPHSAYLNAEDVLRSQETVSGKFVGVGIEFNLMDDTVRVLSVIPGGPASRAGLRGSDILMAADTIELSGIGADNQHIIRHLKGKKGSPVNISILRVASNKTSTIKVIRGDVPIRSVDLTFNPADSIGYIRIQRFSENTTPEMKDALKQLKGKMAKGLILDLRDNPGGLLNQAAEIASMLLEKGDTIVFIENNKGQREYFVNKKSKQTIDVPVVILINEGSASASEIVAGAVQDNDRGLIIGRRSFGKGLVQEEITLPDGSKVQLTTSRYFTPSGRVIQKSYARGYDAYQNEIIDRYHRDVISEPTDDEKNANIYQTRSGRTIYGGGGVRPDIEQKSDTLGFSSSAFHLIGRIGKMQQIYNFVATNYDSLAATPPAKIWATDNAIVFNRALGSTENRDPEDIRQIGRYIKLQILLMVFDRPTMARYSLQDDGYVETAVHALSSAEIHRRLLE